jgi:hypothetical protein
MVQMKIDSTGVDPKKSSGFEPYEGPLPRPGTYAAVIRSCKIRISQAGNPYFNVLFEFADQVNAEKQAFKGYPLWDKIVPGDSDIQKERVGKLAYTVCGKVKAVVNHEEVTDGGTVKTIGGKDPVGVRCKVVVSRGSFNGEPILELRDLFPWPKDEAWPEGSPEDGDDSEEMEEVEDDEADDEADEEEEVEEEDDEAEEEEEEEDDDEFETRKAELAGWSRADLKSGLKELDPDFKFLKKHTDDDLRTALLGLEFPDSDEDGDEEPPF